MSLLEIATREIITLGAGETLQNAARVMAEQHISSILIYQGTGNPAGIVTERDVLRAMLSGRSSDTPLETVMSSPIITVPEQMECQDAYLLCLREGTRHLALMNKEGELTGVVSETDFRLHAGLTALAGRRSVTSVMTRSVLSLPRQASLHQAVELMENHHDSSVVVLEGACPVGILTERDIVRLYAEKDGPTKEVGEIMTTPVLTIFLDGSVQEAAGRMLDARVRHLVVVDGSGELAGLISEHDLTQIMMLGNIDAQLDAERAFLRALIDTIPDLVWLKDLDGVYLACNPRFENLFGAKEEEIIGKTDYDFVSHELAEFLREHDRIALKRDLPTVNEEWLTFAKDGHQELLETIKTPMRNAAGGLIGVLGIGRDITMARRIQEALQDSEEKLRTLIDAIPDSVQFKDSDGRWLAYNRTAARVLGLEAVECSGKSDMELAELADPGHRQALLECYRTDREALHAGRITRHEEEIRQASGEIRHFDVTKVPIHSEDGVPKGLVILARDVTEARRTTRALEQSVRDFNDLVTRIPVGVFKFRSLVDDGYCFDYISPRWCEMVGLNAEVVYRDAEAALAFVHPEDRDEFLRAIEIALRNHAPFDWEGRMRNQGGDRWFHIAATPVPRQNGEIHWDGIQYDITERKLAEQRLTLVNFALNHIHDSVYLVDQAGQFHYVNDEGCRVLGYRRSALRELRVWDVDTEIRPERWPEEWARIKQSGVLTFERRYSSRGGRVFPAEVRTTYFEYLGTPYILNLVRDISSRKKSEESLRLAASVFTNTHEGIVITDRSANIVEVNEAFSRITGYHREEVLGKNPGMLKSGHQDNDFYSEMWQALEQDGHWSGEVWNRRKDGLVYAEHLTISEVRDDAGEVTHYVGVFADITPLKEHEQSLERIAHYDALTGVPNRVLLADRMSQAVAQTRRTGNLMAVCYLDLDGFKQTNDTLGHEAGDLVLVEMTQRMRECLRGGDTIARIGGDEFVLLLLGLNRMRECQAALRRILDVVRQPVLIGDHQISLTASIGLTLFPVDDADPDTLLRHADQAMYQAKEGGKDRSHLFDPEHDRRIRAHRERQQRLNEALEQGEFVLYYQPKVNMRTGEVIGVEALIRWTHPEEGLLLPADFMPVIAGSSLETAIGEWVLGSALGQVAEWEKAGFYTRVSVNIGGNHLLQPNFAERLQSILDRHPEVDPERLELEILESTAIADVEHASRALAACRRMGVHFALDDFGTGYSSLTYFRQLPVETLKIDQSFVQGMLEDPEDLGIVESVLQLTHAFHRSVIAEGVETQEHCALLVNMRCEAGQGFGIARPMPPEQLLGWVAQWRKDQKWQDFSKSPYSSMRGDLVLKGVIENHRSWVDQIAGYLQGSEDVIDLPLDSYQCRFGLWYHSAGAIRYGHLPEFHALNPVHEQIHVKAAELIALAAQGEQDRALEQLDRLYDMRDQLLQVLEHLLEIGGEA